MHAPEPDEWMASDLVRALGAIERGQTLLLADVDQASQGDLAFLDAFRRWQEQLTALKLHLHRAESRLLHYLMAGEGRRPWREFPIPAPGQAAAVAVAVAGRWRERLVPWFQSIRLDTSYRHLESVLDLDEEAVTADVVTDLVTVLEVAELTMPALAGLRRGGEPGWLEDMAFYHVLSPWKRRGLKPMGDCLRWLGEILGEHEDL